MPASLTQFASRQPATYIVGDVFDEPITSSAKMLEKANLADWNVRLRPLDSDARRTKETYETVRDNPFDGGLDRLGIGGERYGTVQNERAFSMFDDLGVSWTAAGAFRGGALVYGEAEIDRSIVLDPNGAADEIKPLVVVSTTHDGSGALRIGRSALRLDCLNMFNLVMRNLSESISVRHTLSVDKRLQKIRQAWKANNLYYDALDAEANALFQKSVTDQQYFDVVKQLIGERPEENKKGAQTKYDNNMELFAQAWRGATNEKVHGTAWGAFQALIERNQWGRTIQQTDNGLENFAMAGIGFDQPTTTFRNKAFEIVKSL